jgi:tRNA threonylcarbamoyladenosine biosynthesis protein TsaB
VPYILNLETTTKNCSVALSKAGQTILYKEIADEGFSHGENLHVFIEKIMAEAQLAFADLAAVAVSQGPGSYTGLRIGVSAAKGLCFALDIPLIATDTLQTLVAQIQVQDGLIVPMIDARRMEVYTAVFDQNGTKLSPTEAKIIDEDAYNDWQGKITFIGDCNAKCQTVLTEARFVFDEEIRLPSARDMAVFSYQKYLEKNFEDVAYFEPFYLKEYRVTKKA